MRGTGRLAGRRALGHHIRAVCAEIRVVALAAPEGVARRLLRPLFIGRAGTQLLAKLDGVKLTVFHALAAGHAFVLVHTGDVIGADGVRCPEVFGNAQRKAGTAAAVADRRRVVIARGDVKLVHQTVILGAPENLIGLLFGDEAVRAGLRIVFGVIVEVHAHVLFQMAAAFAHEPAGAAAGTRADRNGPGILNELVHLVVTCLACIVFNGALNGNDAHQVHAHIHERRQHGNPLAGIAFKTLAQHGIFVTLLAVGEHALHDAGHPDRVVPAELPVDRAGPDYPCELQLFQLLPGKGQVLLGTPGDVFRGSIGFQTHVHHDLAHIVVHDGLENLIFGIVVGDAGVGQAFETDFGCQFQNIGSVCHEITPFL